MRLPITPAFGSGLPSPRLSVATAALLLLGALPLQAAPRPITAGTFTGGNDQNRLLTSITVDSLIYADLIGATSTSSGDRTWLLNGPQPASDGDALSGLTISDGVINALVLFQFGRTVLGSDLMFLFDITNSDTGTAHGDDITVQLVNASGLDVGSPLAIDNDTFGPRLFTDEFQSESGNASLPNGTFGPAGVAFTLADFGGTTTGATGFRISTGSGVDPMAAGIAVVPEPGTVATLLGGLGMLAGYRRLRRK